MEGAPCWHSVDWCLHASCGHPYKPLKKQELLDETPLSYYNAISALIIVPSVDIKYDDNSNR